MGRLSGDGLPFILMPFDPKMNKLYRMSENSAVLLTIVSLKYIIIVYTGSTEMRIWKTAELSLKTE